MVTEGDASILFRDFYERQLRGEPVDFAALCAAHPNLTSELERLQAEFRSTLDLLDRFGSPSFDERLERAHGDDVAPAGGLPTEPAPGQEGRTRARRARYEVRDEIARGGMGAILHVWDEHLRRSLAMKVILEDMAGDERKLARFLEEAQVTGQLDHPGMVPVHELGLDQDGRLYFTMRLVKGRSLKEIFDLSWKEEDGWNQTRALGVVLKVCEAMAFAHEKGVIHRDLKPANIMVGRFGETYVMDWGLARVLGEQDHNDIRLRQEGFSSLTQVETDRDRERTADSPLVTMDGDVVGTPAYMPPEQAMGVVAEVGPRADVYAVGAMLYHLLAGQMPYVPKHARISQRTVLRWVIDGPPKPLARINANVPAELVAICEKAMAREAKNRYQDMLAMAEDLRAYLEHRVVSAYETGAVAEFKKWVSRNKGMAAGIAAAIVIALMGFAAVAAVAALGRHKEEEQKKIAQNESARAKTQEERATREAKRALSLSAIKRLQELRIQMDRDLWPRRLDKVKPMQGWLTLARAEVSRLPEYESYLAEVRAETKSEEQEWLETNLGELVTDAKSFGSGLIADIESRLEIASTIEAKTIDEQIDAWNAAQDAIAANPLYDGLHIEPQVGLVPLRADPESHLWEFWVWESGKRPEQDAKTGRWKITNDTGMVLVLLPGGEFAMGAQKTDPAEPNYDPDADDEESPVTRVTLDAFFLSKYEITQGQWLKVMGRNPSYYSNQSDAKWLDKICPLAHPVEEVSFDDCDQALARFGLVLPTEAQWEYGARGGTDTPWWMGRAKKALKEVANLADHSCQVQGGQALNYEAWDDGYIVHAPVGRFAPNVFGLHDVHGNVWEWCLDHYSLYTSPANPGDGERSSDVRSRMNRGGGFSFAAISARSASRRYAPPENHGAALGCRPARAVYQ